MRSTHLQRICSVICYAWRYGKNFNRRSWVRYAGWLTLLAALVISLVATRYLSHIHTSELRSQLYLACAFIGHFGFLAAMFGLLLLFLGVLLPLRVVLLPVSMLMLIASLTLLAIDTVVYDQYRFHLNGFVWKLLTGPGASEIFHLSRLSLFVLFALAVVIASTSLVCVNIAARLAQKRRAGRISKWVFVCWFSAVLIGQSMHIWYEARYDAEITGITRHFPLYYPLTAMRAQVRFGWLVPDEVRNQQFTKLDGHSVDLAYPTVPMDCRPPPSPMNVLVLVVDSMRADAFTAQIMPKLFALSERDNALMFTDHFSGGNATNSGIFSLFYGISTLYWDAVAAAGAGAEWIRQHQRAGYRIGVFSSSTLMNPGFDRTVFASVPKLRLSSEGRRPSERDRTSIEAFESFVSDRATTKPWFGFLFLDSAHSYDVPEGYDIFKPQWARVDHVLLNENFDPLPYVNRYHNALGFLDDIVGQLLERLDVRGALENTVIVVTSDHGEEFNDVGRNYWGHGSNFFKHQIKVPLMMLWPGKTQQTIRHRTSHFDIAPTLMSELLGCTNPMSDYSMGKSLFDTQAQRDWLLVHSYFNYGVVTNDSVITTYPIGGYEIHDLDGRRIDGAQLESRIQADILRESTRFYR